MKKSAAQQSRYLNENTINNGDDKASAKFEVPILVVEWSKSKEKCRHFI